MHTKTSWPVLFFIVAVTNANAIVVTLSDCFLDIASGSHHLFFCSFFLQGKILFALKSNFHETWLTHKKKQFRHADICILAFGRRKKAVRVLSSIEFIFFLTTFG